MLRSAITDPGHVTDPGQGTVTDPNLNVDSNPDCRMLRVLVIVVSITAVILVIVIIILCVIIQRKKKNSLPGKSGQPLTDASEMNSSAAK